MLTVQEALSSPFKVNPSLHSNLQLSSNRFPVQASCPFVNTNFGQDFPKLFVGSGQYWSRNDLNNLRLQTGSFKFHSATCFVADICILNASLFILLGSGNSEFSTWTR